MRTIALALAVLASAVFLSGCVGYMGYAPYGGYYYQAPVYYPVYRAPYYGPYYYR